MLLPIHRLLNLPIMSLQTGTELARTSEVILDPRQLKIAAFYCDGPLLETRPSVLFPDDIREFSDIGLIVDGNNKLMDPSDVVRLQQILEFRFELVGLKVIDENKRKLGKVVDYGVEAGGYTIQQLYVQQSFLRSFGTMSNTIHRTQIVSITNDTIIVHSPTVRDEVKAVAKGAREAFVNPFREGHQPES